MDSGFHAIDSGFQVLDPVFLSVELGFRIPIFSEVPDSLATFQIPKPKIPDSISKNLPDSEIWIP